jgi:hypothetical protein
MRVVVILLALSCAGCGGFGGKKPEPKQISCDQASIDRQIITASKAGCKKYRIDRDEQFQTCSFTCYESR